MPSNPQKNRLSLDFYCSKIVFHIYKGIKAIDITPIRILLLFLFLRRRSICKSTMEAKNDRFFKKTIHQNKTAGHQSYIFISWYIVNLIIHFAIIAICEKTLRVITLRAFWLCYYGFSLLFFFFFSFFNWFIYVLEYAITFIILYKQQIAKAIIKTLDFDIMLAARKNRSE